MAGLSDLDNLLIDIRSAIGSEDWATARSKVTEAWAVVGIQAEGASGGADVRWANASQALEKLEKLINKRHAGSLGMQTTKIVHRRTSAPL